MNSIWADTQQYLYECHGWLKFLFIGLVVVLAAGLVFLSHRVFRTLTSPLKNIPGPDSSSFVFGHMKDIQGPEALSRRFAMVKKYGRLFRFKGFFGEDQLHVTDPLALHTIIIKELENFEETKRFIHTFRILTGRGILGSEGEEHRRQRKILNPCFSGAHIKGLLSVFYAGANQFRNALSKHIDTVSNQIDVRQWSSRLTLEGVGKGGFGYSFNSFDDSDESGSGEYQALIRGFGLVIRTNPIFRHLAPFIPSLGPAKFRRFLIKLIPFGKVYRTRLIVDGLYQRATDIYMTRKDEIGAEVEGKDIMSVLIRANRSLAKHERLEEDRLLGLINILIIAGVQTTSTALEQLFHLLALYPDVQAKLRAEVLEARQQLTDDEELTHEQLIGLTYLDAIVRETLRVFSPVMLVTRVALKDTVLPLSTPIRTTNGETISSLPIKRGTKIMINIRAVNQDPLIWGPDAHEWKPERWLGRKFSEVPNEKLPGIYSGMMTFLGGSRACIGFKFSELEIKVALATMIQSFQFSLASKDAKLDVTRERAVPLTVTHL